MKPTPLIQVLDEELFGGKAASLGRSLRAVVDLHGGKSLGLYGGGGQGNHSGAAYVNAVIRALGSRTHFSSLAQGSTA